MNYAAQVVILLDWFTHAHPDTLLERAEAMREQLENGAIKFNVREHWDLLQLIEGRITLLREYTARQDDKAAA